MAKNTLTRDQVMFAYESTSRATMARTLWVTSYADFADENPTARILRARPRQNWEEVAPPTYFAVFEAADELAARIGETAELHSRYPMTDLYEMAMSVDRGEAFPMDLVPDTVGSSDVIDEFAFGMTMQSLGHGVSWFDDRKTFDLELPHFEFLIDMNLAEPGWENSGSGCYWSGKKSGERTRSFDLVTFVPDGFQKVCKMLGVPLKPLLQSVMPVISVHAWYWRGPGIEISATTDPVTGEYSFGHRHPDKDYASHLAIRGTPSQVKRATAAIRRHSELIKREKTPLDVRAFSINAPGPMPLLTGPKGNPTDWHGDDGPSEDDYVTTDYVDWWQYSKHVLEVPAKADWRVVLQQHMDREKFYPNVWWISDHGNAHMLDITKENASGRHEVHSKAGLEDVFAREEDAEFFADELRRAGAAGVETKTRGPRHGSHARKRNPTTPPERHRRRVADLGAKMPAQMLAVMGGGRELEQLSLGDAQGVQQSMNRFPRMQFETASARRRARGAILRAARRFGVDTNLFEQKSR